MKKKSKVEEGGKRKGGQWWKEGRKREREGKGGRRK